MGASSLDGGPAGTKMAEAVLSCGTKSLCKVNHLDKNRESPPELIAVEMHELVARNK